MRNRDIRNDTKSTGATTSRLRSGSGTGIPLWIAEDLLDDMIFAEDKMWSLELSYMGLDLVHHPFWELRDGDGDDVL